jgi:ArsR family transcriptional regulator
MDSAEFLDLLGNDNRRRILRLLAQKPCYVTEISEFLGVSPKAVIDHLRKLEDAGLVESRTDDRRRKYFSISRHVRLEVTVSPYEFGTKSAYPASSGLDITSCRRLSIEIERADRDLPDPPEMDEDAHPSTEEIEDNGTAVADMARRLNNLEQLDNELSLAQRWAQGRITTLRDQIADTVEAGDPRLISEVLVALADEGMEVEELSRRIDAPPRIVEDVLDELRQQRIVTRDGREWQLHE